MAGTTRLELATSAVTGQRSNQLSYVPRLFFNNLVICHIESCVSRNSLFSLDSTFSLLWTQFRAEMDTKTATATTEISLSDGHQNLVSNALSPAENFAPLREWPPSTVMSTIGKASSGIITCSTLLGTMFLCSASRITVS